MRTGADILTESRATVRTHWQLSEDLVKCPPCHRPDPGSEFVVHLSRGAWYFGQGGFRLTRLSSSAEQPQMNCSVAGRFLGAHSVENSSMSQLIHPVGPASLTLVPFVGWSQAS